MALDGIFLKCLTDELSQALVGCRVEKIYQPSRDELVFAFRTTSGVKRLFLSARADGARVHITNMPPENPEKPPMFCMLLRKRLSAARLIEIRRVALERIAQFVFSATNDLGDEVTYSLIAEIMGRRSNLILVQDGKIVDAIKRIDFTTSSVRQVLPGEKYVYPPGQDKMDIFHTPAQTVQAALDASQKPPAKAAMDVIMGISPVVAREFAGGLTVRELLEYASHPQPFVLLENERAFDFTFLPVRQYGDLVQMKTYDTFSELLDFYYFERERRARTRQRAHDLFVHVTSLCERAHRKALNREKELADCADKDRLRLWGDLISANMYNLQKGSLFYDLQDFYTGESVRIPADPALTPAQNAQKYYKEYRKKQVAEKMLTGFIRDAHDEADYLETVLDEIERAESGSDISAIRRELADGGFLKRKNAREKAPKPLGPLQFVCDGGLTALVGRNNVQNDRLTLKEARKNDIWLHTKDFPGSHVILQTGGVSPSEQALHDAAVLAAFHSKGSSSSNVAVDYTAVRNVKKPSGAKPGKVIYTDYKTLFVTPTLEEAERLKKQ